MFETSKYLVLNLLTVTMMTSCSSDSFLSYKCDDKYLHVYYGGVSGYRFVVLNNNESMVFTGITNYEKYKLDNTPKLVYESENRIFLTCGQEIRIVTSSEPLINTIIDGVFIEVLEPAQLIDLDTTLYDIVIR